MNTWKDLVPIIQALVEGKSIQYQRGDGDWSDTSGHVIYKDQEYRIKPEPRELYALYSKTVAGSDYLIGIYETSTEADDAHRRESRTITNIIKFREVIDES